MMYTLLVVFAALVPNLCGCFKQTGGQYNKEKDVEVYVCNGQDVAITDHPWHGSYRGSTGSHTCGCAFIGDTWVLTAAHCGGTSAYTLQFGSSDLGSGTVYNIAGVTRHPNYGQGPGFSPNDISVVRAATTISGENIAPASIPPDSNNPGGDGWITGWGRSFDCGTCGLAVTLHGAYMPIISNTECGLGTDTTKICVYDGVSGMSSGDSGGPLSVSGAIYGVGSWGSPSACGSQPSVYTRVGAYRGWVCAVASGAEGC